MEERAYRFTAEEKERIHKTLMMDQALPEIPFEIDHVSYMDGCKVYLKNGGWSAPGSPERNRCFASSVRCRRSMKLCCSVNYLRRFWDCKCPAKSPFFRDFCYNIVIKPYQ